MKIRQRVSKSDTAPTDDESAKQATHRLTGITVKEVSIVDRGANQRKYLLVKQGEPEKAASEAQEAQEAEKAGPPTSPNNEQQPPAPPTPPGPPAAPAPPTLRISPELKGKVLGVLRTAQERIGVITKVLEGSSETPGAAAPQELMDALQQLATLIQQAAGSTQQPGAPAAAPPPSVPAAKDESVVEETEKAGRKISAGRLAQLRAIQETVASLIAEVSDPPAEAGEEQEPQEAEKAAPPPQEQQSAATAEVAEIKAAVAGMAETMRKMTLVFEGQNQRIDSLSKSRGTSTQVDLDVPRSPAAQSRVVWDLDMARPVKNVQ